MDFMELPDGVYPEEVPDLGGPEYDNGYFSTYPERQGWNLSALLDWELPAAYNGWDQIAHSYESDLLAACNGWDLHPLIDRDFSATYSDWDQIAQSNPLGVEREEIFRKIGRDMLKSTVGGFIQTWILFGILNVALRRPVFRREVSIVTETTDANGKKIQRRFISVRDLFVECAINFRDKLQSDPEWSAHLIDCLRVAISFLRDLEERFPSPLYHIIIPRPAELALVVLLSTLDLHQSFHTQRHVRAAMFCCTSLEREMQEQRGWCPSLIERLRPVGGAQGIYYASLLPTLGTGERHDNCNGDTCFASNIDQATYCTMHMSNCLCLDEGCNHQHCACQCVEIPEDEFSGVFEAGGYPLVSFREGKVELVRHKTGIRYVAISHVWSDGRGNPTRNALPPCQLDSIHRWVSDSIGEDTLFWIDTLCVPVNEPLRNAAVMRMAQTYESAIHVLVLSGELLMNDLPRSRLQVLYMVYCSKWMTRLWTMQEAVLAKTLMFQFGDQAVEYSTLWEEVLRSPLVPMVNDSSQSRIVGLYMLSQMELFSSPVLTDIQCSRKLSLSKLLWAWRDRTTSRLTDATICASILLGTDLSRILAVSDDMKMVIFWAGQSRVPVGALWARGPRLEVVGFRWAPKNLLDSLTSRSFLGTHKDEEATATVVTGGLMIFGLTTLLLEKLTPPHNQTSDVHSHFRFSLPDSSQIVKFHFEEGQSSIFKFLMNGQYLLVLDEFQYDPALRRACLTMLLDPIGSTITLDKDHTPISTQYLLNGAVVLDENTELSTDELFDGPLMQVGQVFEPSQRWLIT